MAGLRAKLNKVKPSVVFLVLAILVGGYIRLSNALSTDFPLNDGGLFYLMTQELVENHFQLPLFTNYNHINIPFAYPPLAFYLTGGVSQLFGWSLIDVYRIFPAVVTVLTIPAFYLLAKDLIADENQLSLATLIFCFIPASYDWSIMGGGVTRSPGFLFALLSLHFTFKFFTSRRIKDVVVAALLLSLSILSHPETGFHAAVSVPVFWFFLGRNKKGVWQTGLMALLTIILTAPWWGNVLTAHGVSPFLSALSTSEQNGNAFFFPLNITITNEIGIGSIALLGLIGFILFLSKKRYFLPIWAIFSYTIAPRSAKIFIAPCVAIFASFTIILLIQWLDAKNQAKENKPGETPFLSSFYSKIFLAIMFVQWFNGSMRVLKPFSYNRVTKEDRVALSWVKENTAPESSFAVITNNFWSIDSASEWFPVLTDRKSVATVQGTEWLGGDSYATSKKKAINLQDCVDQSPMCIDTWAQEYNQEFDYLYLRKLKANEFSELAPYQSALAELLKNDPDYTIVFESNEAAIFKRN